MLKNARSRSYLIKILKTLQNIYINVHMNYNQNDNCCSCSPFRHRGSYYQTHFTKKHPHTTNNQALLQYSYFLYKIKIIIMYCAKFDNLHWNIYH